MHVYLSSVNAFDKFNIKFIYIIIVNKVWQFCFFQIDFYGYCKLLTHIFLVNKIMLAKVLMKKKNTIKVVLQTHPLPFPAVNIYLLHLENKCIIYVCLCIRFKSHIKYFCVIYQFNTI